MEWKLLAAIFWRLNPVVIMTKLLRNEMKAKSTDHEGGSNKNYKLSYFPPEIFEIMYRKSIWIFSTTTNKVKRDQWCGFRVLHI